ncbi:MAG TPA: MaoC family dehydratase N-terminal domain-containing protein [Caldimonas sp.]|nr:MaoC family dehydratase N-terminal domain-containing protein [Caldimonas sp.]
MTDEEDSWQAWIGRTETRHDEVRATPVAALSATLDRMPEWPQAGTVLPPLWHWLFFLPLHAHSELGADGHPRRGGFLPPVSLPRRMWAGSQFEFRAPIRVGDAVVRTSTIEHVAAKNGRSGRLVFVKVRHEVQVQGESEPALKEWHDIVYRERQGAGDATAAVAAPAESPWRRRIEPDPVLLFRYSALTFNGHRIHYDRDYATRVEGYPGLVVHGPLIATLLMDLLRRERPDVWVTAFRFKAVRPLFDGGTFHVNGAPSSDGREVHLWASDAEGALAMDAVATLAVANGKA